ncbi:N-acetylmuramoyl-L-alanine amidase [Tomitella biformata]|uniref:N-acetylmuramoyl-L-alanine amidase n=1 Tax=Tomitella biformata TaxID=630403 RepID=UPI000463BA48|nr:N-acetylmuramoyl-L-alanine amidase [Tomitella biformata]
MQPLRLGDQGAAVSEIRAKLTGLGLLDGLEAIDATVQVGSDRWTSRESVFNQALDLAVRTFQQQRGLLVDGVVGNSTYLALHGASFRLGARTLLYQLAAPMYGDDVAALQLRLQDLGFYHGLVDGYFGPITHAALISYQSEYGLAADGICGPGTLRSLQYLGARVTGGSPNALTEHENVRRSGPRLAGKRIVIDPALGGLETGLIIDGPDGPISQAEIIWDLAQRLEGRMAATGMETMLTRGRRNNPSITERAETANAFGADLMISLHCATGSSVRANGVASFHFGTLHGSYSPIGSILTGFIQREIVARTALRDCRSHARTWEVLRLTRMPAVQIDAGYLTNDADSAIMINPQTRDIIAEAILVGIKRLYLLDNDDQPTGTYTFSELLAEELSRAD